jgi:hypothetical protein
MVMELNDLISHREITQVSFVKGEASPIAANRTDQQFFENAAGQLVNFFVRAEGGVSNRPGLQYIATCISATPNGSYLIPFVYNNEQSYICELAAGSLTMYANGVLVEAGVSNPYAYADLPNVRWAQSADVLNLVVTTQPPATLTRTTVSTFSFTTPQYINGPFQDINTDGTTTVYTSGTQGTVTITASKAIFKAGHVGSLFTIQEQFLESIQPWEANKLLTNGSGGALGRYCRSDGKIYQCCYVFSGSGNWATGTFQPVHTSGTQADGNGQTVPNLAPTVGVGWQFVSTNAGVALITAYTSPTQVTAVVQSYKGVYSNFPPTVVGGAVTSVGPFAFTGDGVTVAFSPLTAITTGDPNQFYVTVAGIFQDPTTYSIDESGTSITFNSAPANAAAISVAQVVGTLTQPNYAGSVQPFAGLCLSTYWAFGSFSPIQGYPATVVYFNDRLVFGGTTLQPQTAFTSQTSIYIDFGTSSPQVDSDGITFTMNARRENPILDLIPLNDLLVGTASTVWRITHSASVGAITPTDISLLPQNFYGEQNVPSVQTGDTVIYVQWGGRKIRDLAYQFQYDKFVGTELTVFARQMFPYGTTALRMAFAPEPYGLLHVVRSDGVLCVCTYLPEQQVTAWQRYTTNGYFEDVCCVPENGTFATYVIVRRFVNGQTVRYIERFMPREVSFLADYFFVDSGLTYDGRNSSATTMALSGGSTWLAGDTGTVNATVATFASTDPANNNGIWLYDVGGNRCRLQITGYTSTTKVSVLLLDPCPSGIQGTPTAKWTYAKTNFTGLTNLIGETVAIQADGTVLPQQIVDLSGGLTLPTAGGVVHAGLPYVSQIQSMEFNLQGMPSIRNRSKLATRASIVVDQSVPFTVGPSFDNTVQSQQREFETYGQATNLHTGVLHVQLPTMPTDDATLCIQMSDPAPLTVLGWQIDLDLGEPG